MFWIGLGIGILIGGPIGYFTCALMVIAKQSDIVMEINELNQKPEEK